MDRLPCSGFSLLCDASSQGVKRLLSCVNKGLEQPADSLRFCVVSGFVAPECPDFGHYDRSLFRTVESADEPGEAMYT